MKKTSLLAAVPALALSGLLLSGCGMFRSHKAWETATQESPLEIPPGLDTPSASEALVIPPPGANQPTANGATARVMSTGGQIADAFVVSSPVDATYAKLGQLVDGDALGRVVGHDEAAHSYTLAVSDASYKKRGFFGRMFHRQKRDDAGASGGAVQQVVVTVSASGAQGSEVRAEGPAAAVARLVDTLKPKLGK